MRPTISLTVLAVLAACVGSGCGTFANMQGRDNPSPNGCCMGPPKPFGGVSRDVRWSNEGYGVFLADVPLSLVGDLATLPVILLASWEEQGPTTQREKGDAARKASLVRDVQNAQERRPGDPDQ